MDLGALNAVAGIAALLVTGTGVLWTIRESIKKGVAEDAAALDTKYAAGIAEGERRAQSTIDLRTSERDQARAELAQWSMRDNNQTQRPPRRGGNQNDH